MFIHVLKYTGFLYQLILNHDLNSIFRYLNLHFFYKLLLSSYLDNIRLDLGLYNYKSFMLLPSGVKDKSMSDKSLHVAYVRPL